MAFSDYAPRKNLDDEETGKVHRSIIDVEPAIEWWGNLHYTIGLKYMNKHRGNAPSEFDGITEGNFGFIKYVWEQETQEKHGKISG